VDRVPVPPAFGHRIAQEVFAGGGDAVPEVVRLQPADIGHPERAAEDRILPVRLLDPSPARVAGHVQDGRQRQSGADGEHLVPDHAGHRLDQGRVPGGGEAERLREDRGVALAEAAYRLLVHDDRDTQPGPLDGHALDLVHQPRALLRVQPRRGADSGDLTDPVAHLLRRQLLVEPSIGDERGTP